MFTIPPIPLLDLLDGRRRGSGTVLGAPARGFVPFFPGRRIIDALILVFLDIRRLFEPSAITENHPSLSRRLITPLITVTWRQLCLTTPPAYLHQPVPYHFPERQKKKKDRQDDTPALPRQLRRPRLPDDSAASPARSATTAAPAAPARRSRRLRRLLC